MRKKSYTYIAATVTVRCGALVRTEACMDSTIIGNLPLATKLLITSEQKYVKCAARAGALVHRRHVIEPYRGWISFNTIEIVAPDKKKVLTTNEPIKRRSIENHNVHSARRKSFIDSQELIRYLAAASDTDDIRQWKQRAARIVVQNHQSALANVRRRRLENEAALERIVAEVEAVKAEEAHITRLIFQAFETQSDGLHRCNPEQNKFHEIQQPRSRDDMLLATHGRSYEIENSTRRGSRTRDDIHIISSSSLTKKKRESSILFTSKEWPSLTTTKLFQMQNKEEWSSEVAQIPSENIIPLAKKIRRPRTNGFIHNEKRRSSQNSRNGC